MTKLILNSTEFTINGYNRYTNINDDGVQSNATVLFPGNSQYAELTHVGAISSLAIETDGSTVYSLSNLNAKIASINENLIDGIMQMIANIVFLDNVEAE